MNDRDRFIIGLKGYNYILTKQHIKTLRGQAIKVKIEVVEKGLNKLLKRLDKSIIKSNSCT